MIDITQTLMLLSIGLFAGIYGSIIGAGGGFVLLPVLLLLPAFAGYSPQTITTITLAAALANAIGGSVTYARQKRIDYTLAFIFAGCALPGSILGRIAIESIERSRFMVAFGVLVIFLGLYLINRRAPKTRPDHTGPLPFGFISRELTQPDGLVRTVAVDLRLGALLSFGVGLAASVFGIGGGVLFVPMLVGLLGYPVSRATATSTFFLMLTASAAVATDLLRSNNTLINEWRLAVPIVLGTFLGGQIGATISKYIPPGRILQLLAAALVLIGIRLIMDGRSQLQ